MTPRCLAILQSIPDDYVLPDDDALAVRVIGNAVPPLFYRKLVESFVGGAE
jgi:site-specific DNA-cytosine methylase